MINNAVDEIILRGNIKVSAETEAHKNIEYVINENDLYQINNTSLDENEGKI